MFKYDIICRGITMVSEKFDLLVMLGAFISGAIISFVNNPMLGVAVMLGILTIWGGVKRVPDLKKIKIDK